MASPTPIRLAPTAPLNDDDSQWVSITKRAEGDELTWDDALKTGKKILENHRKRLDSDDTEDTGLDSEKAKDDLRNKYQVKSESRDYEPDDSLKKSLSNDGITTEKGKWLSSHIKEKDCESESKSEFQNAYIYDEKKQEGVIIAENNSRERGAVLTWSEAAFQEYNVKVSHRVLENLKYIYQLYIINSSTKDFITEAIDRGDGREVNVEDEEWHVFRPGSDSFTALLGSENGRGAGYMINDHLAEMGRKRVSEIHVSSRPWLMKIVIGPVPDA